MGLLMLAFWKQRALGTLPVFAFQEVRLAAGATPVLDNVTVAYLPQNTPPVLKSINVITQAAPTVATIAAPPRARTEAT